MIRNQLDGTIVKVHVEHLRKANLDDWEIPKDNSGKPSKKATYVVPPEDSDTDSNSDNMGSKNVLAKLAKKYRKENENSDEEDDIPLKELSKRLKQRDSIESDAEDTSDAESMNQDIQSLESLSEVSDYAISVNETSCKPNRLKVGRRDKVKLLLRSIAGIL